MFLGKEKAREIVLNNNPRYNPDLKPESTHVSPKWGREYIKEHGIEYKKVHYWNSVDYVREIVRQRDKHTCQKCGLKWKVGMRKLDVHHLVPEMNGRSHEKGISKYDRANMDKLITLCHRCHFNYDK